MEVWITYVIAPIAVGFVTWVLGKNGRRIDQTAKVVTLLQEEIGRLSAKVEKLEAKLEIKESAIERCNMVIQEAFKCRTPSYKCPVLIKQSELNHYETKRITEQQSGEYPSQSDPVSGGDCGEGCGL